MAINQRRRITDTEWQIVQEIRKNHEALSKECEEKGIPINDVKHYWYKGDNFSINVKAPTITYMDVREQIIEEMQSHAPKYQPLKRKEIKDKHLLVIDPADIHIGKLGMKSESGEDYNVNIAVNRVVEGIGSLLDKAIGFNIDKIMYVIGNDILHTDNPRRTTTSGTPQDTDGMWHSNFLIAKKLHVGVIDILRGIADVYVQYDPSNHDYTSGFFLADTISSWYSKDKHVQFNTGVSHRKYFRYHDNLIGTTHGDGAKEQDLALLMAHETGVDWSSCKHKYFYTHHIHHKKSKDYMGVTVESMRSPSGPDGWHHRNGYLHSPKGIDAFIHHPKAGQVARLSHIFLD
jgi:hypothetical protein